MHARTSSGLSHNLALHLLLAIAFLLSTVAGAQNEIHRSVTLENSSKAPFEILKGVPGVRIAEELRVVSAGEREWTLAGEENQVANASALLAIYDALEGHRFFEEPNLLTGTEASERRVSFAVEEIDTIEFLRFAAAASGWSVIFDDSVRDGSIEALSVSLEDVPWDTAIETVLDRQGLRAVPFGQVWLLASRKRGAEIARDADPDPCQGENIKVSLENADLVETLRSFGSITGLEMDLPPDLEGSVSLQLDSVPWDNVLQALMLAHGLQYRIEDGVVIVEGIPGLTTRAQGPRSH